MFDVFCLVVYDVNLTIKSCQKEGAHKTSMNNDLQSDWTGLFSFEIQSRGHLPFLAGLLPPSLFSRMCGGLNDHNIYVSGR